MAHQTKYIFVSGGVISALGKGITAASVAFLLKRRGFSVCPIKCENNLNVDFGTINPIEHGDPFLCFDGLEGDQDCGNYERFLNQEIGFKNFMTMGQLYSTVINNERNMRYDGEDVEPIPHIVDEILRRIRKAAKDSKADFCVIELGGTVGEYENNNGLYYEAARLLALKEPVAHVHVTYVLEPPHIGEPKTKPAQFGLKDLMSMGVIPNFIVVRAQHPIDRQRKYKFGIKFGIEEQDIFNAENLSDIHQVPLHLHEQGLDLRILKHFNIKKKTNIKIDDWKKFVKKTLAKKKNTTKIAIVGKYFGTGDSQLNDSYHALFHAIEHAATSADTDVEYILVNSEKEEKTMTKKLKNADGIIVPIGWGNRGIEGKINAIKYAREKKIPYLGLCYGMQLACIEYARNVLKLEDAQTEEVSPKAKNKIIHSIPFNEKYQTIKGENTSMRLGTFDCVIKEGTIAFDIYTKHFSKKELNYNAKDKTITVGERHRHRFEFNNEYRKLFEDSEFIFSGVSPDNFFVEMIELPKDEHPFFVATQAHPEYRSYPLQPHPMFIEFIKASLKK
ncbi:CTP synthase [Candidatus Dojkabacteria bacterium]|uniref:CTP synthase (glutamine hydrolyzing) n=1 Tax=Candidatus Dojkabacteria bacterium TaxID=2099670 RepID=A0A955LAN6_9BACT|nr:CTP synthase [Candidatus Dojkabacteria bacterium]